MKRNIKCTMLLHTLTDLPLELTSTNKKQGPKLNSPNKHWPVQQRLKYLLLPNTLLLCDFEDLRQKAEEH